MSENKKEKQQYLLVGMDKNARAFSYLTNTRKEKKVGMFFWLWIGQPYASGVYDAGKILRKKNGKDLLFKQSTDISPDGQQHFWGKPVWGYYNSSDEWVIRKQIELLMIAGVDFLVFDTTNAVTYPNVYEKVLQIIQEFQNQGWNPPRAAFYTHSYSMRTALQLYHDLYEPKKYQSSWYCEGGKPVIIAYTDPEEDRRWAAKEMKDLTYQPPEYPSEMKELFCFKRPQWPTDPYFSDGFPWIEWQWPQPLHKNMMNVTVASHPNVPFSFTLTRQVENWGRGWDVYSHVNRSKDVDKGTFFQSQWDYALEVDPDTIFVGGWNEWIAYKQLWDGEYMLCDAVDKEFSRDIEPMSGGYEDAYYIQLIENIRHFKGIQETKLQNPDKQITYYSSNLADERDSFGVSQTVRYTEKKQPNRIENITLSHDQNKLKVSVEFGGSMDEAQMKLFTMLLGTGSVHVGAWESYDYSISMDADSQLCLVQLADHAVVASLKFTVCGNRVEFVIPRSELSNNSMLVYFKAAYNVEKPQEIMSYYTSGTALPPGRLSYLYPFAD